MVEIASYLTFSNLFLALLGTAVGIIFGSIPGLTATMGIALFLPFTFGMEPVQAFALLLGIYCGGTYGGAITAILINTPGSPASAATVLDGYPMAQQGKASKALSMAVIASTIGGLFSSAALILVAPQLANFALKFGPPEYFAIGVFGISIVASLSSHSLKKGVLMAALGLLITTIGLDPLTGIARFTYNTVHLMAGINFIPVLIGVFAVAEIFNNLEKAYRPERREQIGNFRGLGVTLQDMKSNIVNFFRSSVIGTIVGVIPATGSGIAGWISYNSARNASKHPERFGKGELGGLVASESANNAVTGGALVPLLTLGIPGDVVTAVMIGALMLQGLTPGPNLFVDHSDVIHGIYVMLITSNIFMLLLGLLGLRLFVKVLKVPMQVLMPLVLVLCLIGSYAIQNSILDMGIALLFGLIGYWLIKMDYSMPSLLLGLVLGNMIEANFRRALTMSQGSLDIFLTRPISLLFITLAIFFCIAPIIKQRKRNKKRDTTAPL